MELIRGQVSLRKAVKKLRKWARSKRKGMNIRNGEKSKRRGMKNIRDELKSRS